MGICAFLDKSAFVYTGQFKSYKILLRLQVYQAHKSVNNTENTSIDYINSTYLLDG